MRAYSPRRSTVDLVAAVLAVPGVARCFTIAPSRSHPTRLRITLEAGPNGQSARTDMTLAEARAWLASEVAS